MNKEEFWKALTEPEPSCYNCRHNRFVYNECNRTALCFGPAIGKHSYQAWIWDGETK